jgi:hypothetical protein
MKNRANPTIRTNCEKAAAGQVLQIIEHEGTGEAFEPNFGCQ